MSHEASCGLAVVAAALAGLGLAACDRPVAAAPPAKPAPIVTIACAPIEKLLQCRAVATAGDQRDGGEPAQQSTAVVHIAVDEERGVPQVAYDVEGVVRDLANAGIADVDVTLADSRGRTQTAKTRGAGGVSDGAFRFTPVVSGTYRLNARRRDYRAVEKTITLPDPSPLTLVMINEPTGK